MTPLVHLTCLSLLASLLAPLRTAEASSSPCSISSIRFDAPGRDERTRRSLNGEVLVVRNRRGTSASLRGWIVRDAGGPRYVFRDVVLRPGETVRLHTGRGRDRSNDVYWDRTSHVWSNTRGRATLSRPGGGTASGCRFGGRDGAVVCLNGADVASAGALQSLIDRPDLRQRSQAGSDRRVRVGRRRLQRQPVADYTPQTP